MNISLENYLRNKLDEVESMHSFELATDTIRCWIDEYKNQRHKEICYKTDKECIYECKGLCRDSC